MQWPRSHSYNYPRPAKTLGITLFTLLQYFEALVPRQHECCSSASVFLFSTTLRTLNAPYVPLRSFLTPRIFCGIPPVNAGNQVL